ncbi:GNAT family N-acetyltransferase [Sphingomonas changnyeongensis]|uniref:GNAT family N-acetyltransferase n=1 Tax=Sphingomonas changnyeongensis TaxID=2698679 RepID=A0A7Z2NXT6_9SPHN|nr:GNAT family N-acetyltransferase [Sphingomonas changnyeongensis]QHL91391.1 GNAT family N-acetyltransferase [Sphingomonas changnyeongensis]
MILYRTPTIADGPELAEMARTSFVETFGHLYRPEDLDAFCAAAFGPDTGIPAQLHDPALSFRIAAVDGRIIGFAKLGPRTLPVENADPRAMELRQLYVLSPWHGQGVAQTLMDWTITTARAAGAPQLYLSVFVDNHRAQRFYQRYGFADIGRYSFMVGAHEDEDRLYQLDLA